MAHRTTLAPLGEVVREAFASRNWLTENGNVTREAERILGFNRHTLTRHLATGGFTAPQLYAIAHAIGTTPAELMARAEVAA